MVSSERTQTSLGGRPSHSIQMTVDAYRFFLAKSNTPQGDANLWYLIEVEKRYRQQLERSLAATPQNTTELDALKAENEKLEQQNQENDIFLKEVIVSIDRAIEEHRLLKNENNKLKEELEEQKDDTKYFFEKAEKLEVPLRKAQKEIEKLKEDFDTAWKYVEHYKQQSDTYEQLAKRAIQQRNALKAENDKLKSANELEEVSPDIKIRRAYWAELMITYAENQKLREQLGMPPLSAESRKSKKTKK
jgi:chromosome segregation ATPase